MPKRTMTVYPLVFILGALLLSLAAYMWSSDRVFYSLTGATAILVMTSAVVFGIRNARLERLEAHLILEGYLPSSRRR